MENISEDIKNQFETGDLILFHTTSKTSGFKVAGIGGSNTVPNVSQRNNLAFASP